MIQKRKIGRKVEGKPMHNPININIISHFQRDTLIMWICLGVRATLPSSQINGQIESTSRKLNFLKLKAQIV